MSSRRLTYYPAQFRGAILPPLPSINEPLPKERRARRKLAKAQENTEREVALGTKKLARRGILGSIGSFLEEVVFQFEKGFDYGTSKLLDQWQEWDYDSSLRFFREKFPQLSSETLWDSGFFCQIINGHAAIPGVILETTNFACFHGFGWRNKDELQVVIPLRMIVSLQKAITLKMQYPHAAPIIRVPMESGVKHDAIQIFTSDQRVHQFFGFLREKSFSNAWNILDHAWRAAANSEPTLLYLNPSATPLPSLTPQSITPPVAHLPLPVYAPTATPYQVITNPFEGASIDPHMVPPTYVQQEVPTLPYQAPNPYVYVNPQSSTSETPLPAVPQTIAADSRPAVT